MLITFSSHAWEDYTTWLKEDRKMLLKINQLIKEIQRTPFEGIGKPEALKYELSGFWSRRINHEHIIIYAVSNNIIVIYSLKFHYTPE